MFSCCGAEAPALWLQGGKTGTGGWQRAAGAEPEGLGERKKGVNELFLNLMQKLGTSTCERTAPRFPYIGISLTRRQGRPLSDNLLMWKL